MGRQGERNFGRYEFSKIKQDGQWVYLDGGSLKVRRYKKNTAHIEVHPEIAWQLNKILAFLHPQAIPGEFKTKPKKQPKTHKLDYDLISFGVAKELDNLSIRKDGLSVSGVNKLLPKTEMTLEFLGGVKDGIDWYFDYDVGEAIKAVIKTGSIPQAKSHQYYPTPKNIAEDLIDQACINDDCKIFEPSAGQGALLAPIPGYLHKNVTCIDISKLHCDIVKSKYPDVSVINADFLGFLSHKGRYDRIIMNPPFSDKRAEDHVVHAYSCLDEGGILCAVMPASYKDKTIIQGVDHEWSEVYKNEFKGCSVNVVILRIGG